MAILNKPLEGPRAPAKIKVIGVGGGGCNAVRRMMAEQTPGVEYIVVNTDIKSLESVQNALSIQIGDHLTHGFGAGGIPAVGEKAAEEGHITLKKAVKDAELVFITSGMGGGTGTGAAPVVAQIAKESGALVVAVVTTPFSFEGHKRLETAMAGIKRLKPEVDNIIVVHNDRLLHFVDHDAGMEEAFRMADEVVTQGILSVSEVVNVPGEINVDLADVKSIMGIRGTALMAIGVGDGQRSALDAAEVAIANPLIDISIKGAKGVLFHFAGGPDLTLGMVNEAGELIREQADREAIMFFGMNEPKEELRGKCKLTLIATGIKNGNHDGTLHRLGEAFKKVTPGIHFEAPSALKRGHPERRY